MRARSLSHLPRRELLEQLADLLAREREITAELVLYLAEVLRRRLHVAEGYPSMHAYCVGALGMSEDSAGKRIRVVRTARRFPQILGMIADGRLHLSAVCLLSAHLTRENAAGLLEAATHQTKRQIELMLAERFPQADVPEVVRALVPAAGKCVPGKVSEQEAGAPGLGSGDLRGAASPLANEPESNAQSPVTQPAPATTTPVMEMSESVPGRILETASPGAVGSYPKVAPLAPQRFAVQFTMDQAMHDDLRRAQALLGHCVAPGEVTEVFRRALRELVTKLEKSRPKAEKRSAVANEPIQAVKSATDTSVTTPQALDATPEPAPMHPPSPHSRTTAPRYIPAHIRREVWLRDQGRCTFVGTTGHRCESQDALEFDHVIPVARGGRSTTANLRLLCRAHNQHEAEQAFGEGFMHAIRERTGGAALP